MINLIIFGFPYSGKGTQGELLAETYNLMHINMGAILRSEAEKGTELGLLSKSYNDKGLFTPTEVVTGIIENVLSENMSKVNGFLFDGYPRTLEQLSDFDRICENVGLEINTVINLEVPREELIKRGIERVKISKRADDTPELIPTRLDVHAELTFPLIEKYRKRGLLVNINGMGTIEEVNHSIDNAIQNVAVKNKE
jgi:adenylate kinase